MKDRYNDEPDITEEEKREAEQNYYDSVREEKEYWKNKEDESE